MRARVRPPSHVRALIAVALLVTGAASCGDDGGRSYPDHQALADYLTDEVGAIDVEEVRAIYPEPVCDESESGFVLVRALDNPPAGKSADVAVTTQVAVDTYLCGPDFARAVIHRTFEGEAAEDLLGLVRDLEGR